MEVALTPELRDAVIDIAQQAGDAIMQIYGTAFDVVQKTDNSPLTAADMASNAVIVEALTRLTPHIPVLSEEQAASHDAHIRQQWPELWVVDPLDGTREFVKRNGEFTVNIALVRHGRAVFGVIQQPVNGAVWWGVPGEGAYKREGQEERSISVTAPANTPLRVAASRSHIDAVTQAYMSRMPSAAPVSCGSSLKFCMIAEGLMDLYPRFGPTSEWDTAAGQAILEAAGGRVADLEGAPLQYNRRETLLNPSFFAIGDSTLPWQSWL